MPLIKRFRRLGVHGTVVAHGEVLFVGTGPVARWSNRFSNRLTAKARAFAPVNKRPRWVHYGKPLKDTIHSTTKVDGKKLQIHTAVGSSAPYSLYVDQGTGVFAGRGAYRAKILPPYYWNSPSLYEHTWKPGGLGRQVSPVMIKGQKGQHFFDKALAATFQNMRLRSFKKAEDTRIKSAFQSMASNILGTPGNTPATPSFIAQLEDWRRWRDEAWNAREGLGRGRGVGSRYQEQWKKEQAAKAEAKAAKAKTPKATKTKKAASAAGSAFEKAKQEDRKRFVRKFTDLRNKGQMPRGARLKNIRFKDGSWYGDVMVEGRFIRTIKSSRVIRR